MKVMGKWNEGNGKKEGMKETPKMGVRAVFGKGCREKKKKWKIKWGSTMCRSAEREKKKKKKMKRADDGESATRKRWEEKITRRKKEK